jgi:hypothetical protein
LTCPPYRRTLLARNAMPAPSIAIDPPSALIDVPRTLRLQGFVPGERVLVITTLRHDDGTSWRGETTFGADNNGDIDLTHVAPLESGYVGASEMGVVWSMQQTAAPPVPRPAVRPLTVHLEARGVTTLARGSFEQHFLAPGVRRSDIRERGLVGTLFTPPGGGPHPVVIVLAGSEAASWKHAPRSSPRTATPPSRSAISARRTCRHTSPARRLNISKPASTGRAEH